MARWTIHAHEQDYSKSHSPSLQGMQGLGSISPSHSSYALALYSRMRLWQSYKAFEVGRSFFSSPLIMVNAAFDAYFEGSFPVESMMDQVFVRTFIFIQACCFLQPAYAQEPLAQGIPETVVSDIPATETDSVPVKKNPIEVTDGRIEDPSSGASTATENPPQLEGAKDKSYLLPDKKSEQVGDPVSPPPSGQTGDKDTRPGNLPEKPVELPNPIPTPPYANEPPEPEPTSYPSESKAQGPRSSERINYETTMTDRLQQLAREIAQLETLRSKVKDSNKKLFESSMRTAAGNRSVARTKLKQMTNADANNWQALKPNLERALKNLQSAVQRARSHVPAN